MQCLRLGHDKDIFHLVHFCSGRNVLEAHLPSQLRFQMTEPTSSLTAASEIPTQGPTTAVPNS